MFFGSHSKLLHIIHRCHVVIHIGHRFKLWYQIMSFNMHKQKKTLDTKNFKMAAIFQDDRH